MKTRFLEIVWRLLVLVSVSFLGMFQSRGAWACGEDGSGFLPENDIKIEVGSNLTPRGFAAYGITEGQFNSIIDKINGFYASIVSSKGGRLVFYRLWNDGTVNAYANRSGSEWQVYLYGGLARHQAMTADGFALIACHELGHHLGGVPKYTGQWAANEGQSDYFANLKCLRRVWENDDNASVVQSLSVPASVSTKCESSFSDLASISLCKREAMAGLSAANVARAISQGGPVSFDTPDQSQVLVTYEKHPAAQCRLDTYLAGSICQVSFNEEIGQSNPSVGTCSEERGDKFGFRPRCWYKPQGVSPSPTPTPTATPTTTPTPPPSSNVAGTPTVNGQAGVTITNPYGWFYVDYNVSNFPTSTGVYWEVVPGSFSQPNSSAPDSRHVSGASQRGQVGKIAINPYQMRWPGYGSYQIRIFALTGNGESAVSKASNGMVINIPLPQRR